MCNFYLNLDVSSGNSELFLFDNGFLWEICLLSYTNYTLRFHPSYPLLKVAHMTCSFVHVLVSEDRNPCTDPRT